MELQIKRLVDVSFPTRAHDTDAGIDLYIPIDTQVRSKSINHIKLGIAIVLPPNHVGIIQGKSGLASKFGLFTIGNIIDEGYTGEISVTVVNEGYDYYSFHKGDKVCQLLVMPVSYPTIVETNQLPETSRGESGFGSSGK